MVCGFQQLTPSNQAIKASELWTVSVNLTL